MDYFISGSHLIVDSSYLYKGINCSGKGFFDWDPNDGLEIRIISDFYEKKTKKTSHGFKVKSFTKRKDCQDIEIILQGGINEKVVLPNINLEENFEVLENGVLHLHVSSFKILKKLNKITDRQIGEGLLQIPKEGNFNSKLNSLVEGKLINQESGIKLEFRLVTNNIIKFNFILDDRNSIKTNSIFEAIRLTLAIYLNCDVVLLNAEYSNKDYYESYFYKKGEPSNFRSIFEFQEFDKNAFLKIVNLLCQRDTTNYQKEALVSRSIISDLIEASNQFSAYAYVIELIIGTMMEAILRTIYKIPYAENEKAINVSNKLNNKKFIREVLKELILEDDIYLVCEAYKHVRHRNVHRDWVTQNIYYDDDNIENTFNNLKTLVWFYQSLIFVFADAPDSIHDLKKLLK